MELLRHLLEQTWQSPVFGDSFNATVSQKTQQVVTQVESVSAGFAKQLGEYITLGMPELNPGEVQKLVAQITPKTVSFCPALAAGELDDIARLQEVSTAIGIMYWADQTMDRGDQAMALALRQASGEAVSVPTELQDLVQARGRALQGIEMAVRAFARPEDAGLVLACYNDQVLYNEARLQVLSEAYLAATDQPAFLRQHGKNIANLMTVDAGFPSVASSLYAIYRQHQPELPPLPEVYDEEPLTNLLQICNAVVRVADELGDADIDAGLHPEWGSFCINLFNQANPALLEPFFELAMIPPAQWPQLSAAFETFGRDPASRPAQAEVILNQLFEHVRQAIAALPPAIATRYHLYIVLCKRVLEIGYVNRVGDMNLGQST